MLEYPCQNYNRTCSCKTKIYRSISVIEFILCVKPDSAKELWDDIQYAMDLGLKTLYYMKTPKSNFELEEVCESCT